MPAESALQDKVTELEQQVEMLKRSRGGIYRGIRKRSTQTLLGMPLYDIALGPDPDTGQIRGHAKGFIAIGDVATGVLAFGGVAVGLVAFGGLALGGVCLGGAALGLLFGMGGAATGAVALGGLAVGGLACGGCAIGYTAIGGFAGGVYAAGGEAVGTHILSAAQQDPEAVQFFSKFADYLPGMRQALGLPRP